MQQFEISCLSDFFICKLYYFKFKCLVFGLYSGVYNNFKQASFLILCLHVTKSKISMLQSSGCYMVYNSVVYVFSESLG